jgi:hypothetical protein
MNELHVVDHTFDLKLASEYQLSIQISLDGFSFCVLNSAKNKIIVFQHVPFAVSNTAFLAKKVESVFEQVPMLNAAYHSVSVSYLTDKSTLIPKLFSEKLLLDTVASLAFDRNKSEVLLTNDLPQFKFQIVFAFPKELLNLLNSKYADYQIKHHAVRLLESAICPTEENQTLVLIHFEKKHFNLMIVKDSDIIFHNCFYYRNESDFLFHTLNCCHKLQIDPEADEMLISGFVADESGYIKQLKKYISSVSFLKPDPEMRYMNIFDKVQKHQFATLLNFQPCE